MRKYFLNLLLFALAFGSIHSKIRAQAIIDSVVTVQPIDPFMAQLDSMAFSLFTRDKFFVSNDELLNSINMPVDQIPRYTEAEIREKLKLIPTEIKMVYNPYVKQFIDMFAYKRRGLMTRCLANSQIYFPIFEEILDKHNVPLEFKYLPIVESAFNPIAVSPAGATGLWQFMHGTGTMMGLDVNTYIDERRDPVKATDAAARFLNKLYAIYGDWHLVLAAYNSGPGNVNKAIARAGGVKNFWAIMPYLPAETRSYVPSFIAAIYVMENYKDFKLVPAEPKRELYLVDTVLITQKVSLRHIANTLSIPEDELQFLNPGIKLGIIPYTANGYPLNLPVNYFTAFENKKQQVMTDSSLLEKEIVATVSSTPKTVYHKVGKYDNISKIAAKYGVTTSNIKKWNKLKSSSVYYGQKLKITYYPIQKAEANPNYAQAFAPNIIEKPKVDSIKVDGDMSTGFNNESTTNEETDVKATDKNTKDHSVIYHVVQKGDTLWGLTQKYSGLTIEKLKADNKAIADRPIKVGDVLKILL